MKIEDDFFFEFQAKFVFTWYLLDFHLIFIVRMIESIGNSEFHKINDSFCGWMRNMKSSISIN